MNHISLIALALAGKSGGNSKIGEFKNYEKKSLSFPNAANDNAWAKGAIVPCSFEPKLIIFYGGNSDTSGNIFKGALMFDSDNNDNRINAGGVWYKNSSNGNNVVGGYTAYAIDGTNHNASAARYQYYDGKINISRVSGAGYWSNTDEYTFEIYG